MSKTRRLISILATASLAATCMTCAALFKVGANAEETWTALNNDTTVSNGVIKSGNTADTNDYVAKYNQAIDLEDGFKVDFTVKSYQGRQGQYWDRLSSSNSIAFALTTGEASTTAQNAYVFTYGLYYEGTSTRLYTYYTKDFKLQNGKISFTHNSGYCDDTTLSNDFDAVETWDTTKGMSLAGDIVNGIPMFWMNGHAVNPFGQSAWGTSYTDMISKLQECYEGFRMDTSALHLYAFNTSAYDQDGEFSVEVESVSSYQSVQSGWVATDTATAETTVNDVVFSDVRGIKDGGMSRTRFIYDQIFDLNTDTIEFQYSTNKEFTPDNCTYISLRGVGMDQLTSIKAIGSTHYENFFFNGGATIGVFDNSGRSHAQGQGLHATPPTEISAVRMDGDWATWTIWFGLTGPENYSFKVNGTTITNYSRAQLVSVLGEDLKAELVFMPNERASQFNAKYRLTDFMKVIMADETSAEYVSGAEGQVVSFNLTMPSDEITVQKVLYGETELTVGTDYTLDEENVLSFAASYFKDLSPDTYTFTVVSNTGTTLTLTVRVLAAITLEFEDKTTLIGSVKDMQNVVFSVVLESDEDEVESVKLEDTEIEFTDAQNITIGADILNKLHVGEYTVTVTTKLSYASFEIEVQAIAKQAPAWKDGQSMLIEINHAEPSDIVLNAELYDAVDYYITINGKEITEAVFDTENGTITLSEAFVGNLPVGNNYVVLHTDAGTPDAAVNISVSFSLGKWSVTSAAVQAPAMGDNGEISMVGSTTLVYQEHLDLSKGYTFAFRFDNVKDFEKVNGKYAEFLVRIEQGNVWYQLYIRTRGNTDDNEFEMEMVQLHQHIIVNGETQEIVAADVRTTPVPHNEIQTWSIKLCDGGNTMLTMLNGKESRENGMKVEDMAGQVFDDATLTVTFSTSSCSEENRNTTAGTLVSIGAFNEELKNIPGWARGEFLQPLPSPVLSAEGNKVSWNAVDGAIMYLLYVNGEMQDSFDAGVTEIDASNYCAAGDTVSIQIQALGDSMEHGDSALSEAVQVTVSSNGGGGSNDKKGCGSVLMSSGAGLSFLLLAGAAVCVVLLRKKEVR